MPTLPEFADPRKQITATFELLPVKNETASKEAGRPIYEDMEICRIRYAGNRQAVGVFPAHEVFAHLPDEFGNQGAVPMSYALFYNEQYLQFKNGDAQTTTGTPLTVLPLVTPGKRLELQAINIRTVEALAGIDGQPLRSLGMGGMNLKNQAQAYLDQAQKLTDGTAMHAEMEALRAQIAELMAAQQRQPSAPTASMQPQDNPFADYEPDDIITWLKDAAPHVAIDGRWGKAKLMEIAAAENAKLRERQAA